jgi:hypothetical protein
MVTSIPFIFGAWAQTDQSFRRRLILVAGLVAALLGVLMASTRVNFIEAAILLLMALSSGRLGHAKRIALVLVVLGIAYTAVSTERFGRFRTLTDSDMVAERIGGSVNRTFWEVLMAHPFGNGLGGGGTSIPYFLQDQVTQPIALESEYARILLEQGIIGLMLWIGFIFWFLFRVTALQKNEWLAARRLAWASCVCNLGIGMLGIGLLTSVPQSVLTLLSMGWISAKQLSEAQPQLQVVQLDRRRKIPAIVNAQEYI